MEAIPQFLDQEAVLALYGDIAQTVGVGIGGIDTSKLGAAVGRPQHVYAYREPPPTTPELAACLAYSLAKFHPFGDGNKRTALASLGLFLLQNGWEITASGMDTAKMIEAAVADEVSEDQFIAWVSAHCEPMEES